MTLSPWLTWLTWPLRLLGFTLWYAAQVVIANVTVVRDNLTPGQASTPGIARVPTRCRTDAEITALAALVTLTPGTLTLGVTRDAGTRVLLVHGMYARDADDLRAEVHHLETRTLRALRRTGDPT